VAENFLDTNVLLYAVGTEPAETRKREIAQNLIRQPGWAWSGQVAAEFVNASTSRKKSIR
jgi:predicted nucleic acid-binding protein